jgi:hypothetical protein
VVVSVAERAGRDPAWVCLGEMSESEPPMKGRKCMVDVKTEPDPIFRICPRLHREYAAEAVLEWARVRGTVQFTRVRG